MGVYTTEIASDKIPSDNPIHQRLLKAYYIAQDYVQGDLLEIGCGEGRGIALLKGQVDSFTAIDKIDEVVERLSKAYPEATFIQDNIPPLNKLEDAQFDVVVTFQVIEHIKDDRQFLEEIRRVLKPGGKALITTPNIKKTLTRNPWHIREYTADELAALAGEVFDTVDMKGITGNEKIWEYYHKNKKAVEKITRFDVFDLQHKLPSSLLKIPYDLLNRLNRNKLQTTNDDLVKQISHEDYLLTDEADDALDLFCIVKK
ncbi:MAG: class I SAM-dependent methyltransferase [Fulvivirga sp.]|nr:class I SAM-dependent methyltransferase [Fulvivirga sp.]